MVYLGVRAISAAKMTSFLNAGTNKISIKRVQGDDFTHKKNTEQYQNVTTAVPMTLKKRSLIEVEYQPRRRELIESFLLLK